MLVPDWEPLRVSWARARRLVQSPRSLSRRIGYAIVDELEDRGVTESDIDALERQEALTDDR